MELQAFRKNLIRASHGDTAFADAVEWLLIITNRAPDHEKHALAHDFLKRQPSPYDNGFVILYRGMSLQEAIKIAQGDFRGLSFYWTPVFKKAIFYAKNMNQKGIICKAFVHSLYVKRYIKEMSEAWLLTEEALSNSPEIAFFTKRWLGWRKVSARRICGYEV